MKTYKFRTLTIFMCILTIGSTVLYQDIAYSRVVRDDTGIPGIFAFVDKEVEIRRGRLSEYKEEVKRVFKMRLIEAVSSKLSTDSHWKNKLAGYTDIVTNSLVRFKPGSLEKIRLAGRITQDLEDFILRIDFYSDSERGLLTEDTRNIDLGLLVDELVKMIDGYYNNPIGEFTQNQINGCLKKFISAEDVQWLMNEFNIDKTTAMDTIMKYNNPWQWLREKLPLAEELMQEFNVAKTTAMYAIMKYSNPRQWLQEILPLAEELMEEFNVSKTTVMYAVRKYSNPRQWLSENIPIAKELYEIYKINGATLSLCMEAIRTIRPGEWIREQLGI